MSLMGPFSVPRTPDRLRRVVENPNLGLYLDRSPHAIPDRGLKDCLNVRVREGRITSENVGYELFMADALNGPVMLIDTFILRTGAEILIFGTDTDLYRYDPVSESPLYITPRFNTGTADVTNGSAVVQLNAAAFAVADIKPGDEFHAGSSTQNDPSSIWYEVLSVNVGLQQITLTANYNEGNQAGVAYTVRQRFSGTSSDVWSSETFPDAQPADEDTWYATQGVTETDRGPEMVKWNGVDATAERFDPGFTARVLRRCKNQLLYGDILEAGESKPYVFAFSTIAIPEAIEGQLPAAEGVDPLLALENLGDVCVAYHSRSKNLLQFVGGTVVWVVRAVDSSSGILSGRSVVDFGHYHEVLADEGLQRFDGVTVEPIATQAFRSVSRQIEADRSFRAIAHVNEENGEVYWITPLATDGGSAGAPRFAFTTHYLEPTGRHLPVMKRQLPAMSMGFSSREAGLRFSDIPEEFQAQNFKWNDRFFGSGFPLSLFGDANGNIFQLNTTSSLNGGSITAFVRTGRRPLIDGVRKGVIRRVEPRSTERTAATAGMGVFLHLYEFADGVTETFAFPSAFDSTHSGLRFVPFRDRGMYAEITFQVAGIEQGWALSGYAIEVVPAGQR